MPYVSFYERFPEIAENETRTMNIIGKTNLPKGSYILTESFCDEEGCDCQRVFLNVFSSRTKRIEAVIAYGWEDAKFYADWFGNDDPSLIEELMGPALNTGSFQSKLAPAILDNVKDVLKNEQYVERIKKHYRMFKETVDKEHKIKRSIKPHRRSKIGRNDPCTCGSGKKYKKCCLEY